MPPPSADGMSIQGALDFARNNEGDPDPHVQHFLEAHLLHVWHRLWAQPNSYVLSRDEFALFNFFRDRFPQLLPVWRHTDELIAQRAVQRFWNSYQNYRR